jgi:predicted GIY-YIG superfamily endonuclease
MNDKQLDEAIVALLNQKRVGDFPFSNLETFSERIKLLKNSKNHFTVNDILGYTKGVAKAKDLIFESDQAKALLPDLCELEPADFKGLYVWFNDGKPFYVGIAKNVITRLAQHIKQPNHNSASMAYKVASRIFEVEVDTRAEFPKEKIKRIQHWLLDQQVAFVPIADNDELAAFEIFAAIKLKTVLNSFETH